MSILDEQDPWSQLLRPHAATRWFEADPLPVLAATAAWSDATAWWLAELSRAVYRDVARDAALAAGGLREIAFVSVGGTQCTVAVSDDPGVAVALCAFRGSDEPRDWVSNLTVAPAAWPGGGVVHRGFRDAFDAAWDELAPVLAGLDRPLLCAGHSLGGALAQLCASRLPVAGCHAFGAPRVGDAAFAATLAGTPVFCVRHGRDVVPTLPPSTALLRLEVAGTEVQLDAVVERRGAGDPPRRFGDHAPVRYVEALRRRL